MITLFGILMGAGVVSSITAAEASAHYSWKLMRICLFIATVAFIGAIVTMFFAAVFGTL